jgi:hypothetical protein
MTNNNYCKELNFNFPILDPSFKFPSIRTTKWDLWVLDPIGYIHTDALKFFNSLGLEIERPHLFKGPGHLKTAIHVDGHGEKAECQPGWAINWVIGSEDSQMIWYKPLKEGNVSKTKAGTSYETWERNDCEELYNYTITTSNPLLVKNNIPHNVINLSNNIRWCISLRFKNPMNWDNAITFFEPFNLDK